jgi:pimeloyl-ACP methyl ester carboxylesterase
MADQGSATTRDGRKLTYGLVGSGPVLLCHPGGPGFSAAYFENLAGLDAHRTLVLVSPPERAAPIRGSRRRTR